MFDMNERMNEWITSQTSSLCQYTIQSSHFSLLVSIGSSSGTGILVFSFFASVCQFASSSLWSSGWLDLFIPCVRTSILHGAIQIHCKHQSIDFPSSLHHHFFCSLIFLFLQILPIIQGLLALGVLLKGSNWEKCFITSQIQCNKYCQSKVTH